MTTTDLDDDGPGRTPTVMAPKDAIEIVECSWKALARNEYGSADLVNTDYAAKVIVDDLEQSDFRIVSAGFLEAADALNEELLKHVDALMDATHGPRAERLEHVAKLVESYERLRYPELH